MTIRSLSAVLALLVCSATPARGQSAPWSFGAAVYTYLLPDEDNYAQPTVAADCECGLHLEARYNYENLETGSVWAGYTFAGGHALAWEVTPLLGGVFGETTGIAPGYKASVNWRRLEGYSEGEYVFDTGETTDSFFYNWSELTIAPVEWLRAGLVTQRTRVYRSDRDIQRGLLVGATYQKLDVTTSLFNPDDSQPTVVVAVTVNW
jgi:hypothetical protein